MPADFGEVVAIGVRLAHPMLDGLPKLFGHPSGRPARSRGPVRGFILKGLNKCCQLDSLLIESGAALCRLYSFFPISTIAFQLSTLGFANRSLRGRGHLIIDVGRWLRDQDVKPRARTGES